MGARVLPIPLAELKGPTSKGRGGQKRGRERKGWGKGRELGKVERKGHTGTSFSPLRALIIIIIIVILIIHIFVEHA